MARFNWQEFENGWTAENIALLSKIFASDDAVGRALRGHVGTDAADFINLFDRHLALAESPIEEKFLLALYEHAAEHGLPIGGLHYPLDGLPKELFLPTDGLYVFPQHEITLSKKYRVDFLLLTNDRNRKGIIRKLVVECDGHDFHERTKEQARNDKSRDRDFVAAGFTVMRFTGSEIHNGASECANQALAFLGRWRS